MSATLGDILMRWRCTTSDKHLITFTVYSPRSNKAIEMVISDFEPHILWLYTILWLCKRVILPMSLRQWNPKSTQITITLYTYLLLMCLMSKRITVWYGKKEIASIHECHTPEAFSIREKRMSIQTECLNAWLHEGEICAKYTLFSQRVMRTTNK